MQLDSINVPLLKRLNTEHASGIDLLRQVSDVFELWPSLLKAVMRNYMSYHEGGYVYLYQHSSGTNTRFGCSFSPTVSKSLPK